MSCVFCSSTLAIQPKYELDLRDRVATVGEEGFLGMAFHPNFATNGRFFVSYICDRKKHKDCRVSGVDRPL